MTNHPLQKTAVTVNWMNLPLGHDPVKRLVLAFDEFNAPTTDVERFDTCKHNKPFIAGKPGPVFAEIALVRLLNEGGWEARWIDNYRNKVWCRMPYEDPEGPEDALPLREQQLYCRIWRANGGRRGGCWDIWAWRGNRHIFVEAKMMGGRDKIRLSQVHWFRAAISQGIPKRSFCVVERRYRRKD